MRVALVKQRKCSRVLLAEPDEVSFAHERLAAGVDEDVRAELLALVDDGVDVVIAQVELVAVLCRPAARAMQVAGGGGVEQDGPGNVALVFLAVLADGLGAAEEAS